jgi:hypothetical protein
VAAPPVELATLHVPLKSVFTAEIVTGVPVGITGHTGVASFVLMA